MPNAARIICAATILAFGFVFTMQYGFGYEPCVLCLWQRVPYGVALLISAAACIPSLKRYDSILLSLCGIAFLIGAGLAIFHTGVELHWWLGTSGCTIQPLSGGSAEDMRTALMHTAVARCDQITWTLFGLSMTNYNIIASLALAGFSYAAAHKAAS
jgi:disulfide bond formation protein DsbB